MVEPLRHRQTKGAETDMPGLQPLRHTSTLPFRTLRCVSEIGWESDGGYSIASFGQEKRRGDPSVITQRLKDTNPNRLK